MVSRFLVTVGRHGEPGIGSAGGKRPLLCRNTEAGSFIGLSAAAALKKVSINCTGFRSMMPIGSSIQEKEYFFGFRNIHFQDNHFQLRNLTFSD
jgi:hypothetical protein